MYRNELDRGGEKNNHGDENKLNDMQWWYIHICIKKGLFLKMCVSGVCLMDMNWESLKGKG